MSLETGSSPTLIFTTGVLPATVLTRVTVASSVTATLYAEHLVTANATIGDPTGTQGGWYRVVVAAGTATVGAVGYAAGTVLVRAWNGSAWVTYPVQTQVSSGRILGRLSAGTGAAEQLNASDAKAWLGITAGDIVDAGVANGVALLDGDGNVIDASGNPVTGGGAGGTVVVSGNVTATASYDHIVVASATIGDPPPSEGEWYRVLVRNGTATVGGVGYVSGLLIRSFHSGAWQTHQVADPTLAQTAAGGAGVQATARGNLGAGAVGDSVFTSATTAAAQQAIGILNPSGDSRAGLALALATGRLQIWNEFSQWAVTTSGGASAPVRNIRNVDLRSGSGGANRSVGVQLANALGNGVGTSFTTFRAEINFSGRLTLGASVTRVGVTTNGVLWLYCGAPTGANAGWANPTVKSVGFRINSATVTGFAHNGTTFQQTGTVGSLASSVTIGLLCIGDGTGRYDFYVETGAGLSLPQTILGGPTGAGSFGQEGIAAQLTNGSDTGDHRIALHSIAFHNE